MTETAWSLDQICMDGAGTDPSELGEAVYDCVCRTSFEAPGFCLIDLGRASDSLAIRKSMVELKRCLAVIQEARHAQSLIYVSAARFDQQETTRPHLDGGPEQSLLMLGYEPSEIESELEIFDYSRCAYDRGLSPREFMAEFNPMFRTGYELLRGYRTPLPCFNHENYQIVCINNSSAPYSVATSAWQGTLHNATIPHPDDNHRRIVNSTMLASVPLGTPEGVSDADQQQFTVTSVVRRRGYDKGHLQDDS